MIHKFRIKIYNNKMNGGKNAESKKGLDATITAGIVNRYLFFFGAQPIFDYRTCKIVYKTKFIIPLQYLYCI